MKQFLFIFFLLLSTSCAKKEYIFKKNGSIIIFKDDDKFKINSSIPFIGQVEYIENGDDLFVISQSKYITKISLLDMTIDWSKELSSIPINNLTFDENYVYFNCYNNSFYMLNYNTGDIENVIFNTNVKTITETRKPYLYNNKIVVFFNNNEFYIIENKKVIGMYFYDYSVDIEENKITIDNNKEVFL